MARVGHKLIAPSGKVGREAASRGVSHYTAYESRPGAKAPEIHPAVRAFARGEIDRVEMLRRLDKDKPVRVSKTPPPRPKVDADLVDA